MIQTMIADRIVVLVDDVRTTGATLDACARVLKDAGAREVRALTVARADVTTVAPASARHHSAGFSRTLYTVHNDRHTMSARCTFLPLALCLALTIACRTEPTMTVHDTTDPRRAERASKRRADTRGPRRSSTRSHGRRRRVRVEMFGTIGGRPRPSAARRRRSAADSRQPRGRSPAGRLRDGQHPRRRGRGQGSRAASGAAPDARRSAALAAIRCLAVRADLQRRRQREDQSRQPRRSSTARSAASAHARTPTASI